MQRIVPLFAIICLAAPSIQAEPILPAGANPDLDAHMHRHDRQFYGINAVPFGLSLDAHALDAESIDSINTFLAQSDSDDVVAVTGKHPYELLSGYGEYGDLGFLGELGWQVRPSPIRHCAVKELRKERWHSGESG